MYLQNKTKQTIAKILRLLPLLICVALIVAAIINRNSLTVEAILRLAPETPFVTALIMLGLYAVKSMSIVFPVIILNVATGILFNPLSALTVNMLGSAVMSTLPYFVGRFSGADYYEKLKHKYPKAAKAVEDRRDGVLFYAFLLRFVNILPGDVVSMFFGAAKVDFLKYLLGSLLGIFPGVVAATFMGYGVIETKGTMFFVSLGLNVLMSITAIVFHIIYENKKKTNKEKKKEQ